MFNKNIEKYIAFPEIQREELCFQNKTVTFLFSLCIEVFDFKTYKDTISV